MFTFKLRRGLAANWSAVNPILQSGEPGVEIDTGKLKIGNGSTPWLELGYLSGEGTPGQDGDSAYEVAVDAGFVGNVSAWLDSLKGETGDTGPQGDPGTDGIDGANGADGADYSGPTITVSTTAPSSPSVGDVWIDTSS